MPEAGRELIRHAFEDLDMKTIWCGYYDGNTKSLRVQEKLGFIYHHSCDEVPVPLLNEVRIGHTNYMTIQGKIDDANSFDFLEFNDKMEPFGRFVGQADFERRTLLGTWKKGDKQLDFFVGK